MVFLDHIYIDAFGELRCRSVMGLMSSHVHSMMSVEFLGVVNGFVGS